MKVLLIPVLLAFQATVLTAQTASQTTDAARISDLATFVYEKGTPYSAMTDPQYMLSLNGCGMSMLQVTRARRSTVFSGVLFNADLTTTQLRPAPDGSFYELIATTSLGVLRFDSSEPVEVRFLQDSEAPPPPIGEGTYLPTAQSVTEWVYSVEGADEEIASLATALMSYRTAYCTPSS